MDYRSFLEEITPYVVVVGSFGRGQENLASDIDCFLRSRPREEVDLEVDNETYMPEILELIKNNNLEWSSVICGHVAVERQPGFPRMIEISSHYRIPCVAQPFYRDVDGVLMLCAEDDKKCDYKLAYDAIVWDDELYDAVIQNPLPAFVPQHHPSISQSSVERTSLDDKIKFADARVAELRPNDKTPVKETMVSQTKTRRRYR